MGLKGLKKETVLCLGVDIPIFKEELLRFMKKELLTIQDICTNIWESEANFHKFKRIGKISLRFARKLKDIGFNVDLFLIK